MKWLLAFVVLVGMTHPVAAQSFDPASFVDPFIGTGGEGNTFPGAVVPWGMVSVSPHTDLTAPAGYRHGDPEIQGFGHVHLSGTGCPDLGNVVLMPSAAPVATADAAASPYRDETASPGTYRVHLTAPNVTVEATATTRTGATRFRFPEAGGALVLDVTQRLAWAGSPGERLRGGAVTRRTATELEGWSQAGSFCSSGNTHRVYFAARLSRVPEAWLVGQGGTLAPWAGQRVTDDTLAVVARFGPGAPVVVQVGISYVDEAGAWANLQAEQPAAESPEAAFVRIQQAARDAWTHELGRVQVEGGTAVQKQVFYSALYHSLLQPAVFSDADGRYRAYRTGDLRSVIGEAEDPRHVRYHVYSLWDTYRTLHPFLSLAYPERQAGMVRTLLAMADEGGRLPKWELAGHETDVMLGDPAAIVIADTYLRGVRDFDVERAYAHLRRSAFDSTTGTRPFLAVYDRLGYLPYEMDRHAVGGDHGVWGNVSTTLEYALADAAVARLARTLGHPADAERLEARSRGYRYFYDPTTRLLRPRYGDGRWLEPFDFLEPGALLYPGKPGFAEGDAWHYTFFVPHDLDGLATLMGACTFVEQLERVFTDGHFILSNQPDMAYPFLFTYLPGEAHRTRRLARWAIDRHFRPGPDGIPGNDDAGTTSAWLVWAALGLYPAEPGADDLRLSRPLFDRIILRPTISGVPLVIETTETTHPADFPAIRWNGVPVQGYAIRQSELRQGGHLHFRMPPDRPATAPHAQPSHRP